MSETPGEMFVSRNVSDRRLGHLSKEYLEETYEQIEKEANEMLSGNYKPRSSSGDGVMVGGTAMCETCGAKLNRVTEKCTDPNHNRPISTSQQSGY
jgi:hypothetical protein